MPDEVKFTSDYFGEMLRYANLLVEEGKAYVCETSQVEIEVERREKRANPYRFR